MSRVGSNPIKTKGITVRIEDRASVYGGQKVVVKGSKGELSVDLRPEVNVKQDGEELIVERNAEFNEKLAKPFHGLYRTLIANAVQGVTEGFTKELEIHGIGYKAQNAGQQLKLDLGYNNQLVFDIPEGIQIEIKDGVDLKVSGADKQIVGKVAAEIRAMKKPEPYKGKGIRYKGEYIKMKVGKSAAA